MPILTHNNVRYHFEAVKSTNPCFGCQMGNSFGHSHCDEKVNRFCNSIRSVDGKTFFKCVRREVVEW